jgi:anthranilate synthase/aminodeoxychorismate synthase-like glutamine amidotransferase
VLLIDNYDSFTWNLAHGLAEAGAEVTVRRHDADLRGRGRGARATPPRHLPRPGRPDETGVSGALVERFHGRLPILGVCLGHQLIVELHGGVVERAQVLVHGKAADVATTGPDALLEGLGRRFAAGRYHSLAAVRPIPDACS